MRQFLPLLMFVLPARADITLAERARRAADACVRDLIEPMSVRHALMRRVRLAEHTPVLESWAEMFVMEYARRLAGTQLTLLIGQDGELRVDGLSDPVPPIADALAHQPLAMVERLRRFLEPQGYELSLELRSDAGIAYAYDLDSKAWIDTPEGSVGGVYALKITPNQSRDATPASARSDDAP